MARISHFGQTPQGEAVDQITLAGGGLTARVLTWGAVLQDLRIGGHDAPLVLGFDSLSAYLDHGAYFGAIVGRCANRIAGATFVLDGQRFQLDRNDGPNHLHGGKGGFAHRVWTVADVSADAVTLRIVSPAAEMGYPGALAVSLTLRLLPQGILDLTLVATCDTPTLCNLAHHSYFNLGDTDILSHALTIDAPHYLPTTPARIPSGKISPVSGAFDFTKPRLLRHACTQSAIDHNFCLSDMPCALRPVANLSYKGLRMQINTDQPGLQIYDAARMHIPVPGLEGRHYGPYAGLAMEPQFWPDAINHPDWAQPILRPGETYHQHTQFVFSETPEAI